MSALWPIIAATSVADYEFKTENDFMETLKRLRADTYLDDDEKELLYEMEFLFTEMGLDEDE